MRMVIEEQKLKLQYATNPKKEIEAKAKYYKMMYENAKKAGNYRDLEVYNVNYKILSENIKKKKFYNVGEQFDAWIYLISQADGVAFFMIIILALFIGSGIVSDEYKERTINLLKTMPVKRGKIILVKFIATVLTLSILIIGIQIIFFIVLGIITDSLKYYDVYYDWISKYKAIGFKIYPILNSSKILTLFECGLLLFLVEIVVIFVICGAIVFFSTIFENGAFAVVSFITMILCISILRQQMFVQRISILKLLPLIFPWNFEEVYSNSLAEKIQLSFVSPYIVIGLNLLLAVIFVLSSIKIFKTKENV
jgi:ABC-2 type transport system permease protein